MKTLNNLAVLFTPIGFPLVFWKEVDLRCITRISLIIILFIDY